MTFFSVCSGIEAASQAWAPLGMTPIGFAEIDPFACAVLAHHHGSNLPGEPLAKNGVPNHGDFTAVDPSTLGRVDVLVGGTPCFTAGHLVLSAKGYVPIEHVCVGDQVMTHAGRLRPVVRVGSKTAATGTLKGVGLSEGIVCTPDHPFRSVLWKNQNTRRGNVYAKIETFGDLEWRHAADMPGHQWCALADYERTTLNFPGRFTVREAMYVAGMYVGDGHIRTWSGSLKKAVVLSLNPAKMEKLVSVIGEGRLTRTQERTSVRATICDTALADFLTENFGRLSHLKTIPAWVLGHAQRADFLRGYLDTDGSKTANGFGASTTSRSLAYGLSALLIAEGYAASVAFVKTPATCVIEGRTVNQRDYWQVRAYRNSVSRKSRVGHGYLLRGVTSFDVGGVDTVYDIEVADDHSYVVNGAVVHNCQDFSIAGLRAGLAGARGNLTLAYAVLAHELARSNGLRNAVWENVPGVLSDKGNAFGCFLGGLVGADDPICTPDGKRWPNIGMVAGPKGRAAWRVLDAQYFGLAQRRKRVFVVADFGNGADPAAVLFERQGMSGNPPPRRKAGKDVAPTLSARTRGGGGLGTDFDLDGGLIPNVYQDVSHCLNAGGMGRVDYETESFVVDGYGVTHALRGHGDYGDGLPALRAAGGDRGGGSEALVCFDARQSDVCVYGNMAAPLDTDGHSQAIAFTRKDHGAGAPHAVAYDLRGREGGAQFEGPHDTANIRAASGGSSRSYVAFAQNSRDEVRSQGGDGSIVGALAAEPGMKQTTYVASEWAVRRLTPLECSRLQGFPDDHARIPWRGKPAEACPDGPQYRAYGNSMAVPVMAWIGKRLLAAMPKGLFD